MTKLTDAKIKSLKTDKLLKKSDGGGLYLEVKPPNIKTWRLAFRIKVNDVAKQRLYTIGKYPDITLAEARKKALEAKALIKQGIDPVKANKKRQSSTFQPVAQQYLATLSKQVTNKRIIRLQGLLNNHIYPTFRDCDIKDISRNDILNLALKLDKLQQKTVAGDALTLIKCVLDFAVDNGITEYSIYSASIRKRLEKHVEQHHPHVTIEEIPALLRDIDKSTSSQMVIIGLKLSLLLFCRAAELRFAEWSHVNLEEGTLTIPSENMKGLRHLKKSGLLSRKIMLSTQAICLLERLYKLTGKQKYLFPNVSKKGVMSDATLTSALNRLGYQKRQDVHGMRGLASTYINEYYPEKRQTMELCLAHKVGNDVHRAYNHAKQLNAQKEVWQLWADYLDSQGLTY